MTVQQQENKMSEVCFLLKMMQGKPKSQGTPKIMFTQLFAM